MITKSQQLLVIILILLFIGYINFNTDKTSKSENKKQSDCPLLPTFDCNSCKVN